MERLVLHLPLERSLLDYLQKLLELNLPAAILVDLIHDLLYLLSWVAESQWNKRLLKFFNSNTPFISVSLYSVTYQSRPHPVLRSTCEVLTTHRHWNWWTTFCHACSTTFWLLILAGRYSSQLYYYCWRAPAFLPLLHNHTLSPVMTCHRCFHRSILKRAIYYRRL